MKTKKTKYYQIDGDNNFFTTLRDAKDHIWIAYTQEERKKYLRDCSIIKVVNGDGVTETPIIITDDGYSFGRTISLVNGSRPCR